MAVLNVEKMLKSHIKSKSPKAKLTNRVVSTVFSGEVDEVSDDGITRFVEGSARANKAEKAKDLTPEDAQLVKDCLRDLMVAKKDFAVGHYRSE